MSNYRVLFGLFGAALLVVGIAVLEAMVPGYNPVRQTVSEIGEVGSPMQLPFTLLLCTVAACVLVFASGLRHVALTTGRSELPGFVTVLMAISATGVGIFSFPHPLHNVFGLSELIGYQAPLVLALTWRRDPTARRAVAASWIFVVLVWLTIVLNLVTIDRGGTLWQLERPFYGVVQRALFAAWFGWAAVIGAMLYRESPKPALKPA
jgi:hypothetical membrane protein